MINFDYATFFRIIACHASTDHFLKLKFLFHTQSKLARMEVVVAITLDIFYLSNLFLLTFRRSINDKLHWNCCKVIR